MDGDKKTWKREVGFVMLAHIIWLTYAGRVDSLEILAWPYILYISTAMGMDWLKGQGLNAMGKVFNRPPYSNSPQ